MQISGPSPRPTEWGALGVGSTSLCLTNPCRWLGCLLTFEKPCPGCHRVTPGDRGQERAMVGCRGSGSWLPEFKAERLHFLAMCLWVWYSLFLCPPSLMSKAGIMTDFQSLWRYNILIHDTSNDIVTWYKTLNQYLAHSRDLVSIICQYYDLKI